MYAKRGNTTGRFNAPNKHQESKMPLIDGPFKSQNSSSNRKSNFSSFLWNSESKKCCGKTFADWALLGIFYLIFYSVLAGMFAVCYAVFSYAVVMRDYPVRTGDNSLLQLTPGLSMVPQPDHYTRLLAWRMSQKYSFRKYVDELVAFTQWYERHGGSSGSSKLTGQGTEGGLNCALYGKRTSDDNRRVCEFNLDVAGLCNYGREFGYDDGQPCIILKLNRVYGWLPDPLDNTSHVKVACYGASDIDKDLLGPICYHDDDDYNNPNQCNKEYGEFKNYYFPYLRQINYQSPLVFVEFTSPQKYTIIRVECQMVAKNLDEKYRFELLLH